jgi:glycosyltransferase involved in cell wall biosynthesis
MDSSKTKVSVVIPVYNGEKTLRQCLESVVHQTYKNYEIIVIDNNSIDTTRHIIKKFCHKNVRYIFEKYKSRGAARNAGIHVGTGEIFAMTDADCIVPKNWLEELTKPILYDAENAVIGYEEDLIKNYWTRNTQKKNEAFLKRSHHDNYIDHIDTKNFAIRSLLMKNAMFDTNIHNFEDLDLYLRLKKKTKIRFLASVKVGHNHKSSFITTVLLHFDRAYWTTKIYKKYKNTGLEKDILMFESISLKNFLLFPFWLVSQFMKKPAGEAYFLLISELSWRAGLIWALVT